MRKLFYCYSQGRHTKEEHERTPGHYSKKYIYMITQCILTVTCVEMKVRLKEMSVKCFGNVTNIREASASAVSINTHKPEKLSIQVVFVTLIYD